MSGAAAAIISARNAAIQKAIYDYFKKNKALSLDNAIIPDIKEISKSLKRIELKTDHLTSSKFVAINKGTGKMWFDETKYLNSKKYARWFSLLMLIVILVVVLWIVLSVLNILY